MMGLGLAELKPSSLGLDMDKSPSSSVEERKKLRARERIREGRIVRLCDRKRWKSGRKIDLSKR
jgi:hypothetical protein